MALIRFCIVERFLTIIFRQKKLQVFVIIKLGSPSDLGRKEYM